MAKDYPCLKRLRSEAVRHITLDGYREGVLNIETYVEEMPVEKGLSREVGLAPLRAVLAECLKRYGHLEPKQRHQSDGWLAPRLHSALRLWRREAADIGIWHFLSVSVCRDYVIWRWENALQKKSAADDSSRENPMQRVLGHDRRNALAHLWWVAELARNGSDYTPVVQACRLQEIIVTLTDVDAGQNRAAAQAFIQFCAQRGAKDVQKFRKAMNCSLVTYMLDAAAPDDEPDIKAIEEWVSHDPEISLLLQDELPEGPHESPVPANNIHDVKEQLVYLEKHMGREVEPAAQPA